MILQIRGPWRSASGKSRLNAPMNEKVQKFERRRFQPSTGLCSCLKHSAPLFPHSLRRRRVARTRLIINFATSRGDEQLISSLHVDGRHVHVHKVDGLHVHRSLLTTWVRSLQQTTSCSWPGPSTALRKLLETFKPLARGDGDQETRGDGVAAPVLRRCHDLQLSDLAPDRTCQVVRRRH